jgi:hypothetical protein
MASGRDVLLLITAVNKRSHPARSGFTAGAFVSFSMKCGTGPRCKNGENFVLTLRSSINEILAQ